MEGDPFHTTSVMTLKLPLIAGMSRLWPHFLLRNRSRREGQDLLLSWCV